MTSEWVETKVKAYQTEKNEYVENFIKLIRDAKTSFRDEFKEIEWESIRNTTIDGLNREKDKTMEMSNGNVIHLSTYIDTVMDDEMSPDDIKKIQKYTNRFIKYYDDNPYKNLIDSEPMEFDGNIVITDPCYIMDDNNKQSDWHKSDYGRHMENIGIKHYISHDTLCGDWDCNTINTTTKEPMGVFCADAGMVIVMYEKDALAYNPSCKDKLHSHCATLIENFKGTIQFTIDVTYEEIGFGSEYKQLIPEYKLSIVGHGVNNKTNEPIEFNTENTWLI